MEATAGIDVFKTSVGGKVILAGDEAYQEEKKLFNGMIDKNPSIIVKYLDVADVKVDDDPDNGEKISWCKNYWKALHPYALGAGYVSFLMNG